MDTESISGILRSCIGEVDEMSGIPELGAETIDIFALVTLKTNEVHNHKQDIIELLKDWPKEISGQPVPQLGEAISYFEAGNVLGSRKDALLLFAFGKILDWWSVASPHMYALKRGYKLADEMFSMGFVIIVGYTPN